jgi:FixJ family two-component response regulator
MRTTQFQLALAETFVMDTRLSISIVDDEEHVRVALRRLCDAYGLPARTFASAEDFLDSLDDSRPECVIFDAQMPGLGGLEAQAVMRERGVRIPAIVITGRDNDEMRARAAALGAHAYLPKPVDAEVLIGAIHSALRDGDRTPIVRGGRSGGR